MSRLLNEKTLKQVAEALSAMKEPVRVLFFGAQDNCEYCTDTRELLEGVASTTDKISLTLHDLEQDAALAQQYNVDKAPTLVLAALNGADVLDYGIRYVGIPAGYEFSALLKDLLLVSSRDSGLSAETRSALQGLDHPVHLQVFVTPTCPYCSGAVVLAHQMALESKWVQAEMVESTEFPELAERYDVSGVPHTVINFGAGSMVGAAPEETLLAEIRDALAVRVN